MKIALKIDFIPILRRKKSFKELILKKIEISIGEDDEKEKEKAEEAKLESMKLQENNPYLGNKDLKENKTPEILEEEN